MSKILGTVIFIHIPTGATLKTHTAKYTNRYFFEKGKRELLNRVMKARDIPADEIDILTHESQLA